MKLFAMVLGARQERLGFAELRPEDDGTITLFASNHLRRVLVNYYFGQEGRVVVLDVDGLLLDGGLRTRKQSHERSWWIVPARPEVAALLMAPDRVR